MITMSETPHKTVLFVDATPWLGGGQRSLLSLLCGLTTTEWGPQLLAADATENGLLASCEAQGIPSRRIDVRHWRCSVRGLQQFLVDRRGFKRVWSETLAGGVPTVVHANGPRAALLVMGLMPARIPLVVHVRDVRVPRIIRRLVAARATRLIAISSATAAVWRPANAKGNVDVVYNGLDIESIQHTEPAPRAVSGNALLVVNVADMVEWKRHELFIEAVGKAMPRLPDLRALIVGRPLTKQGAAYLRRLKASVEARGLQKCVDFVTDADDALPRIAAADLLVSTADAEPFGRTIVEALALGKPVIVTPGFGPEEILGDCEAGTLTAADPAAVADAIVSWHHVERRRSVADAARARASRFSCERMIEGVSRVYDETIELPSNKGSHGVP